MNGKARNGVVASRVVTVLLAVGDLQPARHAHSPKKGVNVARTFPTKATDEHSRPWRRQDQ
jgi:hypothetical protein